MVSEQAVHRPSGRAPVSIEPVFLHKPPFHKVVRNATEGQKTTYWDGREHVGNGRQRQGPAQTHIRPFTDPGHLGGQGSAVKDGYGGSTFHVCLRKLE